MGHIAPCLIATVFPLTVSLRVINSTCKFKRDNQRGGIIKEAGKIFQSTRKERAYFFNSLETSTTSGFNLKRTCRRLQNTNFKMQANIFLYPTNVWNISFTECSFAYLTTSFLNLIVYFLCFTQRFRLGIVTNSQEQTKPLVQNYIYQHAKMRSTQQKY